MSERFPEPPTRRVARDLNPGDTFTVRCPECDRLFDLCDEVDAAELAYGHDCEPGMLGPAVTIVDVYGEQ